MGGPSSAGDDSFDYDQAMYLIGACYDGRGINASDTLNNENFRPHPALKSLLEWHAKRGASQDIRNAGCARLQFTKDGNAPIKNS